MNDDEMPTVEYNAEIEIATFIWALPFVGEYTEQQIGRRTPGSHQSKREYQQCDYDECYPVNVSDTTAELSMQQAQFECSSFDHFLLQLDDVVFNTPFIITGKTLC